MWAYSLWESIFFVISGFIMMLVSDAQAGLPPAAGKFLYRRVSRILPLYWICTLVLALLSLVAPSGAIPAVVSAETIWKSLFFVPFFSELGYLEPILSVSWTLNYEFWFYAIFSLSMMLNAKFRSIIVFLFFLAATVLGRNVYVSSAPSMFAGSTIIYEFCFGMAIYSLYAKKGALRPIPSMLLAACAFTVLVGSAIIAPPSQDARFIVWGGPAAAILYSSLSVPDMRGPAIRLLQSLGDASYSIYLTHPMTLGALFIVSSQFGVDSTAVFIPSGRGDRVPVPRKAPAAVGPCCRGPLEAPSRGG